MPTSDEVWARCCPEHTGKALLICRHVDYDSLSDVFTEHGFSATPMPAEHAAALRAAERADVVFLADTSPRSFFLAGYAHARGKTLLTFSACAAGDWLVKQVCICVADPEALSKAVRALRPHQSP